MKNACCPSIKCLFTECECWGKMQCFLGSFILLALRLYVGWSFFVGGKGKLMNPEQVAGFFGSIGIPFPMLNAYLVGGVETIGGLLLLVGFASRLASVPLSITMMVALATAHKASLLGMFSDPQAFINEKAFFFLLTTLLVLSFGPGCVSLDMWLKKRCCKKEGDQSGASGSSCCRS